jgi:LacI family transcriptional regulator
LRDAGIEPDASLLAETSFDRAGGYEAMRALLSRAQPPTAVLVDNNIAGTGAYRALVESGTKIGTEVSLIVYDGVPPDVAFPHTVTAVVQRTGQSTGHIIAELVMDAINDRTGCTHRLVQPSVEPGDTDGPPV